MDSAILQWLGQTLDPDHIRGKRVLEVGSYDVNGTPRSVIEPMEPAEYIGIDIIDGPGVDKILDCLDIPSTFSDQFDLVISCEALEHMQDWQACWLAMASVAHMLIVTTRSEPFGIHCWPHDYWRFSQLTIIEIARASGLSVVECVQDWEYPGVFIKTINPFKHYDIKAHEQQLNSLENPPTPIQWEA